VESTIRTLLESIAANVRRLRVAEGRTQQQVADQAGIDVTFLQRVERGSSNLSIAVLARLADTLETQVTDLLRPARMESRRRGRPPSRGSPSSRRS
jgi:transcriptional regulator with XRE-family HTH domain